jgi:hypothetical protein
MTDLLWAYHPLILVVLGFALGVSVMRCFR